MRLKQTERILDYMKRFGGITTLEAFRDLGVARLGSRIYDLKREGYDIVSEPMQSKNRYGETVYFKKYMLKQDKLEIANENHYPVI